MDMITLGTQQFINLEFFLAQQQASMVYWYGHQTSDQKVPRSKLSAATRIFLAEGKKNSCHYLALTAISAICGTSDELLFPSHL